MYHQPLFPRNFIMLLHFFSFFLLYVVAFRYLCIASVIIALVLTSSFAHPCPVSPSGCVFTPPSTVCALSSLHGVFLPPPRCLLPPSSQLLLFLPGFLHSSSSV
eukprot:GILI01046305.1.p3 GENE.GILI01046305.1~~GILI01046305.1.p3  ORF type:complete len:104 (+),score=16.62 GILI01046305.1:199-510(+)